MAETRTRTVARSVARTLLGSLVVLVTVPTGVGPVAGGWLAGRDAKRAGRGVLAAGVAGLLGALPWAAVVFLAASGAIEPVGYHRGIVHVGVRTASPATLVRWQEVGLTALVTVTVVGVAVAGGALAGLPGGSLGRLRDELSQ